MNLSLFCVCYFDSLSVTTIKSVFKDHVTSVSIIFTVCYCGGSAVRSVMENM